MNSSKVKEFVKSHKKELIAGAMLVGGTVLVIVGVRHSRKKVAMLQKTFENDVSIPEGFKRWKPSMLWKENGYLNAIIEEVPLSDLGELGKQYVENGLGEAGDIASIIIGTEVKK